MDRGFKSDLSMDSLGLPIMRTINLNKTMSEDELNEVEIKSPLAQQLLLQDKSIEDLNNCKVKRQSLFDFPGLNKEPYNAFRGPTPNPFYHHQKRKLLVRYQEQLLQKQILKEHQEEQRKKQEEHEIQLKLQREIQRSIR